MSKTSKSRPADRKGDGEGRRLTRQVNLDEAEYEQISEAAQAAGLSFSAYVRMTMLSHVKQGKEA